MNKDLILPIYPEKIFLYHLEMSYAALFQMLDTSQAELKTNEWQMNMFIPHLSARKPFANFLHLLSPAAQIKSASNMTHQQLSDKKIEKE